MISIHAPRVGCDLSNGVKCLEDWDISIHAPRVGCDGLVKGGGVPLHIISIHAPRVGCDLSKLQYVCATFYFNPRTPCGVRPKHPQRVRGAYLFQSTHPVWGATFFISLDLVRVLEFQSTHPVWGATSWSGTSPTPSHGFQSTHPVWGATSFFNWSYQMPNLISIHAPRVGCDLPWHCRCSHSRKDFNPRTPCGVRLVIYGLSATRIVISIHAPRVGCDPVWGLFLYLGGISIHAPRVGCDRFCVLVY